MRRTLFLLTLAAAVPFLGVSAQAHPDFSGTWKINAIKSDAMPGRRGQEMDISQMLLTITQTEETLTIAQTGAGPERTMTYYLDGRETKNPGPRGEMISTTTWDDGKLVTDGSMTMQTPRGEMTMTMHEVRSLNKDGTEMTVSTTMDTPMGKRTQKRVFERQE
jgi:hypothetical protein